MKNFKKINELFTNITKQIYKRHDNNFLIILDNWKLIVGSHLSKKSLPKKLNKDNTLIVLVDNEYLLDFQYQTENFKKKINALLESNTICKIKLLMKK
tara:strand:+ start:218 stop:511 length:294 start_codon:yes stop_codon:yes gene_type:complete